MNKLLEVCEREDLGYVSNLLFVLNVLYLFLCIQKGNETIGFRFASPTFYPMRENETQLSSFLFNILIMNMSSLGATIYACNVMFSYTKNSFLY